MVMNVIGRSGANSNMPQINSREAYVAIRPDGFVDGVCFTQSFDTESWLNDMKQKGFDIKVRDRIEAKRILFTNIKSGKLLA